MCQPEPAPHQAAIAEELLDPGWGGVGGHVEVLGLPSQQEVPDAAPHQVGRVAVLPETAEDLERVGTDHGAGNGMFRPRNNSWGA